MTEAGVTEKLHPIWDYFDGKTVVASWSAISYTVEFNGNGADSGSMTAQSYTYENGVALKNNEFTKAGYEFDGWIMEDGTILGNAVDGSRLTIKDNDTVLLKVNWKPLRYNIVFNGNGATSGTMANQVATYGEAVDLRLNEYVRTGYEFNGWSKATDSTLDYVNGGRVGAKNERYENPFNLYARWIATRSIVGRLILHGNGGTIDGVNIATISLAYGEAITLPEIFRDGYTFQNKWALGSPTGVDYVVPEKCNFEGDVHIYALWQINEYRIVYRSNNGENKVATVSAMYGTNVTTRKAADLGFNKVGHRFVNWGKVERGYDETVNEDVSINVSDLLRRFGADKNNVITLYARYDARVMNISFVGGDGSRKVMAAQSATYGKDETINKNQFERDSYTFSGWATNSTTMRFAYIDEANIDDVIKDNPGRDNLTLYAIWVIDTNRAKVTYEYRGGYVGVATMSVRYVERGSTFDYVPAKREGFTQGEYEDAAGNTLVRGVTIINNDINAYATWQEKEYTIRYNGRGGTPSDAMLLDERTYKYNK